MSDRHLVYSSEDGLISKSSQPNPKQKNKPKQSASTLATIKNPNKQGVRIQRQSKGRGGKTVCLITGLTLSDDGLHMLGKTLKAQLGTGGAVKEGIIEIQGDHREKILEALAKQGIQAKIAGG